jgi:hypothetical protein
MDDLSLWKMMFIAVVIAFAMAGQGLHYWAGNGGQRSVVLPAWLALIAASAALVVGSISLNLNSAVAEAYALLGVICVVIFTVMTSDILKRTKVADRNKLLSEDL